MISRGLDTEDFVWSIDHSRRRYLVRETRCSDLVYLNCKSRHGRITIIKLHDGIDMVVLPVTAGNSSERWVNTDAYAEHSLHLIQINRALRNQEDY